MKRLLLVVACILLLTGVAGAVTYDLKTDWSNTDNPNGVWAYNQGTTLLPFQSDYDLTHSFATNQQAWAYSAFPDLGHVPVWMQASTNGLFNTDVIAGDIIMHPYSSPSSNYPYGEGNVIWTSPYTGTALITGNVWYAGSTAYPGRSNDWALYLNGMTLDSGNVASGDGRSNPTTWSFSKNLNVGDVIMFQATAPSTGAYPYFAGVNLTIDVTPVPLPGAVWLLGSGLLGLAGWRRFRIS